MCVISYEYYVRKWERFGAGARGVVLLQLDLTRGSRKHQNVWCGAAA